nr:HepT-like ribonuclease domain-containing protein [Duganella violaceicalia]
MAPSRKVVIRRKAIWIFWLEILGEASYNVHKYYPECAGKHPELALSSVCQMRNAVAHGYFKVDYEIV